jgi:hypothetical protein
MRFGLGISMAFVLELDRSQVDFDPESNSRYRLVLLWQVNATSCLISEGFDQVQVCVKEMI